MAGMRRWFGSMMGMLGIIGHSVLLAAAQPPPTTEFVPVDQLPPSEQLPAAPLLIAAYAFAWVAVLGYLWSVWRRLVRVEGELTTLEQRLKK
jgi:CcmD family protein